MKLPQSEIQGQWKSSAEGSPRQHTKTRCAFTREEDVKLMNLVNQIGQHSWKEIATYLPGKTTRQCRERYQLYLRPEIKNGPWSYEEDELLTQLVSQHGTKWVFIAQHFEGRSDANVKNRWYCRQRSMQRKNDINSLAVQSSLFDIHFEEFDEIFSSPESIFD